MTKFSSITFIWSGFEVEQILLENKYFSKDNQKIQKYICIFALFAFFLQGPLQSFKGQKKFTTFLLYSQHNRSWLISVRWRRYITFFFLRTGAGTTQ